VWVVDDTGFAKDGPASACVARQYSGPGKVGNCQIAVGVHAATDAASPVIDEPAGRGLRPPPITAKSLSSGKP
jgi:SRSO17 transposase